MFLSGQIHSDLMHDTPQVQGNALFEEIEDGLSEDLASAIAVWANSCRNLL